MKHYFSLFSLVGLLYLTGCSNTVQSIPSLDVQETSEVTVGVTKDEEAIVLSEPITYLSDEQLEEYKTEREDSILTTFKACVSEDSEVLVNTEFFDARIQMCRAPDYAEDFYIETFENEVVYYNLKNNQREIWHRIFVDTTNIPIETYGSFIEHYLGEYSAFFEVEPDYLYTKNVFTTDNLFIMLTYTDDSIWIGMSDCEKLTSEVLKTFKKEKEGIS